MSESVDALAPDEHTGSNLDELIPIKTAEVLSLSQVRCFMDCQVRWFKYKLRVPEPPTSKMALGKAVHAALAHNFEQKLDTREDLPVPGVLALFREAWIAERRRRNFATMRIPRNSGMRGGVGPQVC